MKNLKFAFLSALLLGSCSLIGGNASKPLLNAYYRDRYLPLTFVK